jgi:CheY-like chemotaxis protein
MVVSEPAPLVLLVDDFCDTRDLYRDYLEFLGYRVAVAETAEEALDRTFVLSPDIILMDMSLPGLDGWSATAHLKGDERSRNIPIVAFTGHVLETSRERARHAGCDAFITKPCEPSTIKNTLHDLLGVRTPAAALRS